MNILAVDDDAVILEILSVSIESFSTHKVELANSGQDALDMIANAPDLYDCFLLDIQMPGMTGIELCSRIREQPDYAEVPIIMVTAMSGKKHIDHAFMAGATDYVTKPYDLLDLKARLNAAEKLSRAVDSSHQTTLRNTALSATPNVTQMHRESTYKVSDVIPVLDVVGMLTTNTFGNYLEQMKRGQLSRTRFLAVKVVNIDAIHAHAVGDEFEEIIFDLSEAVASVFRPLGGIMTYFGNGIFCCAMDSRLQIEFNDIAMKLEDAVYSLDLCYNSGTPLSVGFTIGAPVSSGFFAKSDSSEMINKAIQNLESQAAHHRMVSI